MTLPEAMLWNRLRGTKLGFKVRRQHPIGSYIVDFYVREQSIVIEVDGEVHDSAERARRDEARDTFLAGNGYRVLRIRAADVLQNMEVVLDAITARVARPLHQPSAGPPPHAGEES